MHIENSQTALHAGSDNVNHLKAPGNVDISAATLSKASLQEKALQGLQVIYDFVTVEEETLLIQQLDAQHWAGRGVEPNPEMKRRHQHYGGVFSYRLRRAVGEMEALPNMFDFLTRRLLGHGIYSKSPNSSIVNEYEAGQGIMPHVDAPKLFGPTITALSLLSDCVMTFQHVKDHSLVYRVHLPRRSLVVMNESCRYDYKHSISKDLVEFVDGIEIVRARRVSITYRDMLLDDAKNDDGGAGEHPAPPAARPVAATER